MYIGKHATLDALCFQHDPKILQTPVSKLRTSSLSIRPHQVSDGLA